eukprot:CAMPEP_0185843996 /NCGR_PEP_ID=MMETSP1354-20130828/329_1 /TAXON_ID=708628 /ORGANISM="Erythrolobus madagascarensis, Strain CCMP3276" /LENGTH=265 /DNA_ID=CAMNT_0028543599 /DNA_START=36 /DNA_END=833 /DNA_ORIENTATION=+
MALPQSDAERVKVQQLREKVEADFKESPMSAEHRTFLTDITYTRYLRARGQNVDKAYAMLCTSLKWREKEAPASLVCAACMRNKRSHTMRCIGRDKLGRPVFYSHFTGVENRVPEENAHHLIWMLENCFADEPDTPQQYVWVVDFVGFGRQDLNPAIGKKSLQVFSDQYPERLGKALILDSPMVFSGLWRILSAFIDAHTHTKVEFVSMRSRKPAFDALMDAELVERLEAEISDARNPQKLKEKNWWTTAEEPCPSLKHAQLAQC